MAVYEIRDHKPTPPAEQLRPRRREVKPVSPAVKSRPVDLLRLPGRRDVEEQDSWHQRNQEGQEAVEKSARVLIRHINQQLELLQIDIHLALFQDEDGYTLDLHDCRDGIVCAKVAEVPIDIDELPNLLQRLKQQAGILFDSNL